MPLRAGLGMPASDGTYITVPLAPNFPNNNIALRAAGLKRARMARVYLSPRSAVVTGYDDAHSWPTRT